MVLRDESPVHDGATLLKEATELLSAGQLQHCTDLASLVRAKYLAAGNFAEAARAEMLLAQANTLDSRFETAYAHAAAARHSFATAGMTADYAQALALLAYISSNLGRETESLEHGYFSVKLHDHLIGPGAGRVLALNYLGVALFWAGQLRTADEVLTTATAAADELGGTALSLQPRLNRAAAEMFEQVTLRRLSKKSCEPAHLLTLLHECHRVVHEGGVLPGAPASEVLLCVLDCMSAIGTSWAANFTGAKEFLRSCERRVQHFPPTSWVHLLVMMARWELAWHEGDLELAESSAREMVAEARTGEHVPMRTVAQHLLCEALEAQGRFQEALDEHRELETLDFSRRAGGALYADIVAGQKVEVYRRSLAPTE